QDGRNAAMGARVHRGTARAEHDERAQRHAPRSLVPGVPDLHLSSSSDTMPSVQCDAQRARATGDDDDCVYCLDVADHHNLFAGDILVHNCQDLNAAQLELALKCRAPGGRMLFVGDRCQPKGTLVSLPYGKAVPIEELQIGDRVVGYIPRDSAFAMTGHCVNGITKRPYDGELIVVSTPAGHKSRYTPNHH